MTSSDVSALFRGSTDVKTKITIKIKKISFIWGPPPQYGRQVVADRKVYYEINERNTTLDDIIKALAKDIMPKRNGWIFLKKRNLKIFNQDGYRITSVSLIENNGTYYVDFKFPEKVTYSPKPTPTRRLGCISTPAPTPSTTE